MRGGEETGAEAGSVVGVDDDDGARNLLRQELLESFLQVVAKERVVLKKAAVHGDHGSRYLATVLGGTFPPDLLQNPDNTGGSQPRAAPRHHVAHADNQLPRLQRRVRYLMVRNRNIENKMLFEQI